MRSTERLPEPWRSFFADLDRALTEQVSLHCCGGFVVTQLYGVARTTSDVDFLDAAPNMSGYLVDVAFGRSKRMTSLFPSWSGTANATGTMCSNSRKAAT
jgi:hypothetical protein